MSKQLDHGQEKRRLLGWLGLLAPLPLPLEDVLGWPVLFLYSAFLIYFLQRIESGRQTWLSNRAMNVLGLVYMPILGIDLYDALLRDRVVRALLHLILFLVVVKLFALRRERDKWHVFVAIYVLFVAAMASSSDLTIMFYLVAGMLAGFYVMARFAHMHVVAAVGDRRPRAGEVDSPAASSSGPVFPRSKFVTLVATLLVIAMAVPIFATMPRLRQPFVMGRGGGNTSLSRTTGFSDAVDLNLTSEVRGNRAVAMRLQFSEPVNEAELRFKGATYELYRRKNWYRNRVEVRSLVRDDRRLFRLPGPLEASTVPGEAPQPAADAVPRPESTLEATIYLEPIDSASLILPTETLAFELQAPLARLRLDAGGAVQLPTLPPRQTLRYDVRLADDPWISAIHVPAADVGDLLAPAPNGPTSDDPDLEILAAEETVSVETVAVETGSVETVAVETGSSETAVLDEEAEEQPPEADERGPRFDGLDLGGVTPQIAALAARVVAGAPTDDLDRPAVPAAAVPAAAESASGESASDSAPAIPALADSGLADSGLADPGLASPAPPGLANEDPTPTDSMRVDRILTHLLEEYSYTLDFSDREGDDPIEDFLFVHKSGHCEFFATSMVLMLRSQGIPARFVTGFLGAELNPIEDYFIVRQQNAHAWVEAWTEDRGWRIYDPTPPDGRPAQAVRDWKLLMQQMYDYVAFRWDRYVLTYGSDDQESFFRQAQEQLVALWQRWFGEPEAPASPPFVDDGSAVELAILDGADGQPLWQRPAVRLGGLALLLLILGLAFLYWRFRPYGAEEAYDRLRRGAGRLGLPVDESVPPLALRTLLIAHHPATAEDVRPLVSAYVEQSFGGRPVAAERAKELRPRVERILKRVEVETRDRRRAASKGLEVPLDPSSTS